MVNEIKISTKRTGIYLQGITVGGNLFFNNPNLRLVKNKKIIGIINL